MISVTGSDSVGGGLVADIFPVNKSITFPRFRDIFCTFSAHLRIIRCLWTLAEIQGHFPCLLTHSNHVTASIHSGKKTFTKSLGGPWPPWPPPLATPLVRDGLGQFRSHGLGGGYDESGGYDFTIARVWETFTEAVEETITD